MFHTERTGSRTKHRRAVAALIDFPPARQVVSDVVEDALVHFSIVNRLAIAAYYLLFYQKFNLERLSIRGRLDVATTLV